MHINKLYNKLGIVFFILLVLQGYVFAQVDSSQNAPPFDSQLLRLKVPVAFQKSRLKLEVFADSSWQLYRGNEALDLIQALQLLDLSDKMDEYEKHLKLEAKYNWEYRGRRVIGLISTLGGVTYLAFTWKKGLVYQILGYVALIHGGQRLWESRNVEVKALREQYFISSVLTPSEIELLVKDYNFRLYQYLSNAGIQFRDI